MIGAVEIAIQERITAVSKLKVLGYSIRKVDSLPIDIDDRLKEHVSSFPAAWTVFGGFTPVSEMSSGAQLVEATYHVVCGAQNLRNEAAARLGAGSAVGSIQMVEDIIGMLLGNNLGLDIQALKLGACRSLYSGKLQGELKASLFAVAFTTRFTIDPVAYDILADRALGDFALFHVGWLPAGADDEDGETSFTDTVLPILGDDA